MRPLLLALTLFALPCLATAGALGEQPVQMPAPYRPLGSPGAYSSFKPAAAPERQRPMKHRWGFGLDSIPGASTPSLSSALVQEPNAVTVRWWATDRLGIDVAAAFSSSSVSSGSTASTSGSSFGAGVGFKYNLSEPSKDLLAQLVMKASTASTQQSGGTAQLSTQAVFVGAEIGRAHV